MKSLKKLRKSKRDVFDLLSIKDINKKVKDPLPVKDKEIEYNLVLIIKSLNNIICHSGSLSLNSDNFKQELNFIEIEAYLKQFQSKPYYQNKIAPLIEVLKVLYLKTKKEKAFLNIAKDMNITINEKNMITDSQIDLLNYMLINSYERLILLDSDIFDVFYFLKDIFTFLTDDYKYLLDYYFLIQLHTYNVLSSQRFKETQKTKFDRKKYIGVSKILFDIIYKIKNNTLLELAFSLFCQHYLYFRDNSFVFLPINKWIFLILKALKGEIKFLFSDNKENEKEYYSLSKLIHMKYYFGEIERNKKRKRKLEDERISVVCAEDLPTSQRSTLLPNMKMVDKYEAASDFLEDDACEIYPKELYFSKGPSEIFLINLFKFNESEKENVKSNKEIYNIHKNELIQGALIVADKILKFNYDKKEYKDYDEKYFCTKLIDEVIKLFLKNDELHLIKRCLNCFGSILLRQPKVIIDCIPSIIIRLSENVLNNKIEYLVNQLNYFFSNCNIFFQKAFENNDIELIKKINKICNNSVLMSSFVLLNPFIFKLKMLKLNTTNKSSHDKIVNNIQSLINEYFIFCSSLVYNYLLLNDFILTVYIEVIIIYFIEKSTPELIRKYMLKIITKVYREKLLKRIFNQLFIDESGYLKLKTIFYVLRYISSEKNKKNNSLFLMKFLEENDKINNSDSSKILDFLSKHLVNKDTKFYFIDFYKHKTSSNNVISNESIIDDENEYVEIYDTMNPKSNAKIFKYFLHIIFKCMHEAKELEDIASLNKILTMLLINIVPLEKKQIYQLLEFLIEYLNNITQMISAQGHKIWQNYFKQYLELLNYVNSYINIRNNNFKDEDTLDENYIQSLIDSYNKIILSLFKLIPNNLSSKDYDILNMIPTIYSYLLTLDILHKFNETQIKYLDNETNINNNENKISKELLTILNKYLNNNKQKSQSTFNSCSISLYYIFYYLKNISKKEYFDIFYTIIIRSLSIDDFKYENNVINAANFILIKLCVKIFYEEKEYISKEEDEVLSNYDKKYQFIQKLHKFIRQSTKENINENKNSINNDESKVDFSILKEQDYDTRIGLINRYLKFSRDTNFININLENHKKDDENFESKIEKYKETKDIVNCRYQKWLIFIQMLLNSKSKKAKASDINDNIDFLFNSSFSFTESKPIHFISIIKSEELDDNDFNLFSNFYSILGNVIINEDEFAIKKENIFDNIIFRFDKSTLHGVVIVLIKKLFMEDDAHFSGNFIVYVKPLNVNGLYFIKIQKNSDFKMKNNNAFKLLTQIDQDFNKIFSDFIILDTTNEKQNEYFFNLIEMIFNYAFLEEQINAQ